MFGYYTVIILLSWAALLTMGILVYENNRILPADKRTLYLTYLLVFLASAAEWVGLRINGLPFVPTWILRAVKFLDYTLTPMCGAIFPSASCASRGAFCLIGNAKQFPMRQERIPHLLSCRHGIPSLFCYSIDTICFDCSNITLSEQSVIHRICEGCQILGFLQIRSIAEEQ